MVELFANNGDPDQTPQNAASDLSTLLAKYPFMGSRVFNGLFHLSLMFLQ